MLAKSSIINEIKQRKEEIVWCEALVISPRLPMLLLVLCSKDPTISDPCLAVDRWSVDAQNPSPSLVFIGMEYLGNMKSS